MRRGATETDRSTPEGSEADLEERVFSKFPVFREFKRIAVGVPREDWNELPVDLAVNLDDYLHPDPKR